MRRGLYRQWSAWLRRAPPTFYATHPRSQPRKDKTDSSRSHYRYIEASKYDIYVVFVYVWAFTQIQSCSTGFSPVVRHGKYPIYWCLDLRIDVVHSIWLRVYCQRCVSILNRSSICVCMGFYSNSIILNRVFTGRASWKISYILMLRSTNRCCTQYLITCLLSTMC